MKWLLGASYIRPATIAKVREAITDAQACGHKRIKVRPASYIGEPSPVATVCVGTGEIIFRVIYQ